MDECKHRPGAVEFSDARDVIQNPKLESVTYCPKCKTWYVVNTTSPNNRGVIVK